MPEYRFSADLWMHQGGSWHFVTVPFDEADEIEEVAADAKRGFGSVRVRVRIGSSSWDTSLYPDTKATSYVLPIKKPVRVKEGLEVGKPVLVSLTLLDV
jgi:hypothetical protein